MDLLCDYKLEFRELEPGEHLYDDVDMRVQSVVAAEYGYRAGHAENPDVCALPELYTNAELMEAATILLPDYNLQEIQNMKVYQRKENLLLLQKAYCPLSHLFDVAYAVDKALLTSYMLRESRCSTRSDELVGDTVLSVKNNQPGRPFSFLLTGLSGCGKTVAITQIKNLYPTAIRHTLGNWEYVQIPILMCAALVGNLRELVVAYAVEIDEILDTGTYHADKVRNKNVGMCCNLLKDWIKRYHIGLLIIDEVQFMNFGTTSSSFENLVGISEATGCSLGLIGNNDVIAKINRYPRLVGRIMSSRIEVGFKDEVSRKFFEAAVTRLWEYQWTDKRTELTPEIKQQLLSDSMYNIAILKALLIRVQFEALKKYPADGITAEYIHNIAIKEFTQIQALILQDTAEAEKKLLKLLQKSLNQVSDDAIEQARKEQMLALTDYKKSEFSAENEAKLQDVQKILKYFGYTASQIKRAIRLAANKQQDLQFMDVPYIVDAAKEILESGKPEVGVVMKKNKEIDEHGEQVVHELVEGEKYAVSNL